MTDRAGWGTSIGRSLLTGQRPVLVAARREDPAQEIQFADGRVLDNPSTEPLFLHDDDVI
jgi:hypothetical protein